MEPYTTMRLATKSAYECRCTCIFLQASSSVCMSFLSCYVCCLTVVFVFFMCLVKFICVYIFCVYRNPSRLGLGEKWKLLSEGLGEGTRYHGIVHIMFLSSNLFNNFCQTIQFYLRQVHVCLSSKQYACHCVCFTVGLHRAYPTRWITFRLLRWKCIQVASTLFPYFTLPRAHRVL